MFSPLREANTLRSQQMQGWMKFVFKVSQIFTFYLTGSFNRNAISESSQVLEPLSYVNEVSYTPC